MLSIIFMAKRNPNKLDIRVSAILDMKALIF